MNVEKLIALLPMKGHSERVPNKNMKMFCGEPLYHAVMKSLEACDYVSEIVIDTDSDIIAEDAVRNFRKVRILRRPQELQGDFVSMNEIINYDLTRHPEEKHFLQTHSTNPLISSATLNAAIQRYFAALGEGYEIPVSFLLGERLGHQSQSGGTYPHARSASDLRRKLQFLHFLGRFVSCRRKQKNRIASRNVRSQQAGGHRHRRQRRFYFSGNTLRKQKISENYE